MYEISRRDSNPQPSDRQAGIPLVSSCFKNSYTRLLISKKGCTVAVKQSSNEDEVTGELQMTPK